MPIRGEIAELYLEFSDFILCDNPITRSTWEADLSTGKALEFIAQFALLDCLRELGALIAISNYYHQNPARFYLRNDIPMHHGAQAGHDAAFENDFPLAERFLAAMLPKADILINGINLMLFREGNPLHLLLHTWNGGDIYKERPDFALIEGEISVEHCNNLSITIMHKSGGGQAEITMSIKNTNVIPLKEYLISDDYVVATLGLIECSVSKTKIHVDKQLDKYAELFKSKSSIPRCLFINGDKYQSKYETIFVDTKDLKKAFASTRLKESIKQYLEAITNK